MFRINNKDNRMTSVTSATSKCNSLPFQRYGLPKYEPKKVLHTLFPCNIYAKAKWNSLRILRNKNLVKRHKHLSLNASNIHYFRISHVDRFRVSIIPSLTTRKCYTQQKVCMRNWWRCFGVFVNNIKHISQHPLILLLTLNIYLFIGKLTWIFPSYRNKSIDFVF